MKLKPTFFILLTAIIIFQFSFFGLTYFEVLDDNNQLGVFNILNDDIGENIIKDYKSYNVRPLAYVSDVYVFQWFSNNLYIVLLTMLIMHVFNVFFIYKIAEKIGVKLNAFCLVLFALSPILIEGLYWISASTRIVISLFFSLASIYLLLKSFDEDRKKQKIFYLIVSIILNLICVGYYEQTVALNLFLFVFVLICLKKYKYIFIPLTSTAWIGVWYLYFMLNGQMQERGTLGISGIFSKGIHLVKQVYIYYRNAFYNFRYSLGFGKEVILSAVLSVVLFALIATFVYYIYKNKCNKDENEKNNIWKKIILGGIIFATPFLPFLILESGVLAVRNFYISTLGLSIIIGVLVDLILKLIKNETACNIIKTILIGVITCLFVVSNIDGVNNYKKVKAIDDKVAKQIVEELGEQAFEEQKTISINYDAEALYKYKNLSNYVESTPEAGWTLMGKIQVYRNDVDVGMIYINSMQDEADYVLYFDNEMNLIH